LSGLFQGILLAIASAFLFGFYMTPRKGSVLSDFQFPPSMAMGIVIAIATAAAVTGNLSFRPFEGEWLAFLGGVLWGLGTSAYAASVRLIGLSRATPIKDSSTVLGVLVGTIFFREIPPMERPVQFMAALAGSVFIVSSALLLQLTLVPSNSTERRLKASGIALATSACLCHALYLMPAGRSLGLAPSVFAMLLPLSLGILAIMFVPCVFGSGLVSWLRQPLAGHARAWLAGLLWSGGQILLWNAIARAGIAVSWGLCGLDNAIAIAYGIVVFKEIHVGKHRREVFLGLAACLLGTLLLSVSRL
jgi:glucose uptake protein GlcU